MDRKEEIAALEIKWDRLSSKAEIAVLDAEAALQELWPLGSFAYTRYNSLVEVIGVHDCNHLIVRSIRDDGSFIEDPNKLTRVIEPEEDFSSENAQRVYTNYLALRPSEAKKFFDFLKNNVRHYNI
jgi:hypothetical protein